MGSDAHLVVVGGAPWLADTAVARVQDLERRWSRFLPDSEISRANARAGSWTQVSPETLALVERAELARRRTDGRFDPTRLADVEHAGYDRSFDQLAERGHDPYRGADRARPTAQSVDDGGETTDTATATAAVVLVDRARSSVLVPPGVGFDPGGIGKGFAADLVLDELLAEGAGGACVNLGGDVRVGGLGPDGGDWKVTVEDPRDPAGPPVVTLLLADGAVATSSRCRRQWRRDDGTPAHHLIDPTTGAPAVTPTLSATVIASEGWQAEALAKVAFLAPPEAFVARLTEAGATGLVVTEDGVLRAPDLARFVAPARPTTPR